MHKWIIMLTLAFFIFILWIIYQANTGSSSIFFQLVRSIPAGDKWGHFFLFGLLTLGVNAVTHFKTVHWRVLKIYRGTLFVSIFVLIEEFSQHFIKTRRLDIMDLSADAAGILLFTLISWFVGSKIQSRA